MYNQPGKIKQIMRGIKILMKLKRQFTGLEIPHLKQ